MKMRPDQERVRNLLLDTVTLLCKNGLDYKREMKVQGLIGITIDDDDVFLVHFDELSELPGAEDTSSTTAEVSKKKKRSSDVIDLDLSGGPQAAKQQKLMDDGVMNNPMSKRLDLSSSLRQSHPDVKPKIKEEKLEDCVVLDDQFEDSKANIVGDFELENASNLNQMAALSGFPHGSSPAGAGGGGRGAPPGGPMSAQFFPGQPGAPVPPDMGLLTPEQMMHWNLDFGNSPKAYRPRVSNSKAFVCEFPGCDKNFYLKHNLNRHQRTKHGRTWEEACTDPLSNAHSLEGRLRRAIDEDSMNKDLSWLKRICQQQRQLTEQEYAMRAFQEAEDRRTDNGDETPGSHGAPRSSGASRDSLAGVTGTSTQVRSENSQCNSEVSQNSVTSRITKVKEERPEEPAGQLPPLKEITFDALTNETQYSDVDLSDPESRSSSAK